MRSGWWCSPSSTWWGASRGTRASTPPHRRAAGLDALAAGQRARGGADLRRHGHQRGGERGWRGAGAARRGGLVPQRVSPRGARRGPGVRRPSRAGDDAASRGGPVRQCDRGGSRALLPYSSTRCRPG
jgi:hypothetical protein